MKKKFILLIIPVYFILSQILFCQTNPCWDNPEVQCTTKTIKNHVWNCDPPNQQEACEFIVTFCYRVIDDGNGNILYRDIYISSYQAVMYDPVNFPPLGYSNIPCNCMNADAAILELIWEDADVIKAFHINDQYSSDSCYNDCRLFVGGCSTSGFDDHGIPIWQTCDGISCCRANFQVCFKKQCINQPPGCTNFQVTSFNMILEDNDLSAPCPTDPVPCIHNCEFEINWNGRKTIEPEISNNHDELLNIQNNNSFTFIDEFINYLDKFRNFDYDISFYSYNGLEISHLNKNEIITVGNNFYDKIIPGVYFYLIKLNGNNNYYGRILKIK